MLASVVLLALLCACVTVLLSNFMTTYKTVSDASKMRSVLDAVEEQIRVELMHSQRITIENGVESKYITYTPEGGTYDRIMDFRKVPVGDTRTTTGHLSVRYTVTDGVEQGVISAPSPSDQAYPYYNKELGPDNKLYMGFTVTGTFKYNRDKEYVKVSLNVTSGKKMEEDVSVFYVDVS